jgi:hypothetical protein
MASCRNWPVRLGENLLHPEKKGVFASRQRMLLIAPFLAHHRYSLEKSLSRSDSKGAARNDFFSLSSHSQLPQLTPDISAKGSVGSRPEGGAEPAPRMVNASPYHTLHAYILNSHDCIPEGSYE